MTQTIKRIAMSTLCVVAMAAAFSVPEVAQAAHKYRFTGTCHGFHGEQHLIDALLHMDAALFAPRRHTRILETIAAKREVLAAYRESCDRLAKRELLTAVRALSRYVGTSAPCDLDAAAAAINQALDLERTAHRGPVLQAPVRPSVSLGGRNFRVRFSF